MPYVIDHFAQKYTLLRHDDPIFQQVDPVEPETIAQPVPVPEATESDFAAFEALQGGVA